MPNFKEFIKGFEEKPEAEQPMQEQPAQEQPKEKRQHLPLYSNERRYIPATKTKYEKVGGKWQQMGEPETKNYTKEQAGNFFDKNGLPFEGGHRFEKKNLAHSEKYDTATVYNPDKTQKMVVDVDYEAGNKAFDKIRNKSLYDRERYKKMKEAKAQQAQQEEAPKAEPKPNGYYKDEKGEIYMMKDGQDYYPVGEKERYDFFTAFNNQNKAQDDISAPAPQPKQGSFEQAFGDMSKPEQGLGDFNPSERIEDYQSGAKTHSENEFRLEALNDRGMYDFISKNRDYLYRKANSDPEGAIKDIIRHGQNNYGIKPENIRKDYAMEVLKSFYEDDEGAIPDFTKQEEFKPSEQIEEFNDYYGAKTNSERNLNLLTGNDRGAYEYVTQNRDALSKEAEYDPAMVLNKIKWHANNREMARGIKGDSIRKDYLISVIKGIVED